MDYDEYFMSIACLVSYKSEDPITQVGSIIVDQNNNIVSTGFNGFPKNCNFSWSKEDKKLFVIHAEENCILNAKSTQNSTMYCTLFPCNKCSQSIVQCGIKKIIYLDEKESNTMFEASKRILEMGKVEVFKYKRKGKTITLNL